MTVYKEVETPFGNVVISSEKNSYGHNFSVGTVRIMTRGEIFSYEEEGSRGPVTPAQFLDFDGRHVYIDHIFADAGSRIVDFSSGKPSYGAGYAWAMKDEKRVELTPSEISSLFDAIQPSIDAARDDKFIAKVNLEIFEDEHRSAYKEAKSVERILANLEAVRNKGRDLGYGNFMAEREAEIDEVYRKYS